MPSHKHATMNFSKITLFIRRQARLVLARYWHEPTINGKPLPPPDLALLEDLQELGKLPGSIIQTLEKGVKVEVFYSEMLEGWHRRQGWETVPVDGKIAARLFLGQFLDEQSGRAKSTSNIIWESSRSRKVWKLNPYLNGLRKKKSKQGEMAYFNDWPDSPELEHTILGRLFTQEYPNFEAALKKEIEALRLGRTLRGGEAPRPDLKVKSL